MIKRSGYFWQLYGFTTTHMVGIHVVSGVLAMVGVGMAVFALLGIGELGDRMFYRLLVGSAVVTLAGIAMILYSIFTILFFRFADRESDRDAK